MAPWITTESFDRDLVAAVAGGGGGGVRSGVKTFAIPGDQWSELLAVKPGPAGTWYWAGTTQQGAPLAVPLNPLAFQFRPWVWRTLGNGDPDPTWNGGAPRVLDLGQGATLGWDGEATEILVDLATGKCVVGSYYNDNNTQATLYDLWSINNDGTDDATFAGGAHHVQGIPHATGGPVDRVRLGRQLLGANAGKIVVAIQRRGAGVSWVNTFRYSSAGVLDAGYNGVGFTQDEFAVGSLTTPQCLLISSDDSIYVGGYMDPTGGQRWSWLLIKYTPNGGYPGGWGGLGDGAAWVRWDPSQNASCALTHLLEHSSGKIIGVGSSSYNGGGSQQLNVLRWTQPAGALDAGYATAGVFTADYHAAFQPDTTPSQAVLLAGDEIAWAGVTSGAVAGGGFSDGGQYATGRLSDGGAVIDRWHQTLPALGKRSMAHYAAGGTGFPAGVATDLAGGGHTWTVAAAPGNALASAVKYLLSGALDTLFGD